MEAYPLKCVIVGDGAIGKTCLLVSYTKKEFPKEYCPTVFENLNFDVHLNEKKYSLILCDTAGQEEFDRLRVLSYPLTEVFLLCFSTVMPSSFYNIKDKWVPEINFHNSKTPYILVGLQSDLKDNPMVIERLRTENEIPIDVHKGEKLAKAIGALKYIECSAFTQVIYF
jgi:small GTP-binding protein